MSIVVSIIDDHPMVIAGIENMLRNNDRIVIKGTYNDAATLKEGLMRVCPDVLLLDILLPDAKGHELAGELKGIYPHIRIIALTSLDAPSHVKAMMKAGCNAYLLKNTGQETLVHAIEEVYEGKSFIDPLLEKRLAENILQFQKSKQDTMPFAQLSSREQEILQLIAEEYTNREIADKLFLSLRTVQNHFFNLQQKLQAKNAVAMVKIAIQMGLVKA